MYTIIIDSLLINGNHGVFEEERKLGNEFQFNLEVQLPWEESLENDNLSEGIDYSSLVNIIEEENSLPSNLLEHLGYRIVNRIYKEYHSVLNVKLKVGKKNPPLKASMEAISIEIEQ